MSNGNSSSSKPRGRPKKKVISNGSIGETENRINQVITMFLNGHSRASILTECSKAWGVTDRTVRVVIDKSYQALKEIYKIQREDLAEVINSHYWSLYLKAQEKGDLYLVRLVLADIARIGGVGAETSSNNSNVTVTFSRDTGNKKDTGKEPIDSNNESNN